MRPNRQQEGFILIMVIALIPLLGMASVILTSNSRQILTNTRRAGLKTRAQLACESGIEWIKKNKNAATENQPIILKIDTGDKVVHCRIELISRADNQFIFDVTGFAGDKRFSYEQHQEFNLKY